MKNRLRLIVGSAIGLALAAGAAQALTLSGSTAGYFEGASSGYTTISNTPDGSFASFRTGLPVNSFKSGVVFNSTSFTNLSSGDTFGLGVITYYNGVTRIGTSSADALFDFYINVSSPSVSPSSFLLTTVDFGIDATVNTPQNTNPDVFTASFTQPAPFLIDGQWVKFTIKDLPSSTKVNENTFIKLAEVTVTFLNMSPVPEPATYGLMGALGLMGLVGYRRLRAQRGSNVVSAVAAV